MARGVAVFIGSSKFCHDFIFAAFLISFLAARAAEKLKTFCM